MNVKCCACDPRSLAVALARWCLGIMFLFAGIGKFPNISGFVGYMTETFKATWLPKALLVPYAYALPFVEVALGVLLILGIARNAVLFITGLLLISLTFGQILLKAPIVFNNLVYTMIAAAILFLAEYDCWLLPLGNRRKTPDLPMPAASSRSAPPA
jgi:thiosulfate dehydrogenase (quinone) large subunit